jgi:hypothetical protein
MDEVWKEVIGLEGRYLVSNYGNFRSSNGPKKLYIEKTGYARLYVRLIGEPKVRKLIKFMAHRLVWEAFNGPIPKDKVMDHIDGNKLNNRLDNLRLASHAQNNMNVGKINKITKSIYKGLQYVKRNINKPWEARFRFCNKIYLLGAYRTELEAAIAYDLKAIELAGPFARTNLITTADNLGAAS